MEAIERKAIETYSSNLTYLSTNHPDLFKRLSLLNTALEQGVYESKYALEYKDGYFDVLEKTSNRFLYNENSQEHAIQTANTINTKKDNHLFEGIRIYDTNKKVVDFTQKDVLKELVPIMRYVSTHVNSTMNMIKIEKFIFIGTGLGLHLTQIDKAIHSEEYLIIEDNLELFRLSLFTTDYMLLGENSTLHFSIADRADKFALIINNFLHGTFMNNRYLKYYHLPSHDIDKIKLIQSALSIQSFLIFTYDFTMDKFLRPLEYINHGFNVLNLASEWESSPFANKPVLLLAAGPSLQKNIAWVKNNQDKFIIVALSATLKKLYAEDIVPDIVTHIDGTEMSMLHFDGIPLDKYLKDTLFILGPYSPKSLREMIDKERIFYFEDATHYFENFGSLSTPCVGTTTLALMLIFNVAELYLLGLDLALDQITGKTHADHHDFIQTIDINTTVLSQTMNVETTTFLVKGNLRHNVHTTSLLDASIQALYGLIPHLKSTSQNIYNLSDGAMLQESKPMIIHDINTQSLKTIDRVSLYSALYQSLSQHSALVLSKPDIQSMYKRLEHISWIKNRLAEHKKIIHQNVDSYYYHLLGLISDLIKHKERESVNVSAILYSYFQYVTPIIFDMFNTKELLNPKKHIKQIDRILISELYNIVKHYEAELQKFLNVCAINEKKTDSNE